MNPISYISGKVPGTDHILQPVLQEVPGVCVILGPVLDQVDLCALVDSCQRHSLGVPVKLSINHKQ